MDDFTRKNAFKPLFTTKENGFGLGLSIVHSITESLGGEASIISRAGRGTLIRINIPS
jgi:Signal transduction histidine kinase